VHVGQRDISLSGQLALYLRPVDTVRSWTETSLAAPFFLSDRLPQMDERVLIWFNTRLVIGHYVFDDADGLVTIKTEHGSKTIQIGKYSPRLLAELMLRELAEEGKA
jgi:hypothetical protein